MMESENSNYCLKAGQFTVCLRDDGVGFTYKPIGASAMSKVIPYSDIQEVTIGPKWSPFPVMRIFVQGDKKVYFFRGGNQYAAAFEHNRVGILPWKRKDWEKLAADIRNHIPRANTL